MTHFYIKRKPRRYLAYHAKWLYAYSGINLPIAWAPMAIISSRNRKPIELPPQHARATLHDYLARDGQAHEYVLELVEN